MSISTIEQAVKAVKNNKLIVLPTDTVYGIGASPNERNNIKAILQAKGRGGEKPPPILVANIEQAKTFAIVENKFLALLEKFWPGALTVILPMRPETNWDLGDKNSTVAVRIPDDELAIKILEQTGPLAVTSANLTTMPPALEIEKAIEYFGDKVAAYIDGGKAKLGVSSTIVDLCGDEYKILRQGDVSKEMLQEYLGEVN